MSRKLDKKQARGKALLSSFDRIWTRTHSRTDTL